jgi:hypothetical protein
VFAVLGYVFRIDQIVRVVEQLKGHPSPDTSHHTTG